MWEHGGCLESVQQDAISRCGHLECHTWRMCHAWACHAGLETENMIKAMPCKQDVAAWMALLSARKIHDTVEMGEPVAKRILELEAKNTVG
ncbi:unnamed protein product [Sphagnum balticum]